MADVIFGNGKVDQNSTQNGGPIIIKSIIGSMDASRSNTGALNRVKFAMKVATLSPSPSKIDPSHSWNPFVQSAL